MLYKMKFVGKLLPDGGKLFFCDNLSTIYKIYITQLALNALRIQNKIINLKNAFIRNYNI